VAIPQLQPFPGGIRVLTSDVQFWSWSRDRNFRSWSSVLSLETRGFGLGLMSFGLSLGLGLEPYDLVNVTGSHGKYTVLESTLETASRLGQPF